MSEKATSYTVFWSWQSDSDPAVNRNFIQDCLERAAKKLGRRGGFVVAVDRDTKGVGGTPGISDTILMKIRAADIFVWDATLVYRTPRPAPNPNVLLEHGYALAIMGEGRMVGVMNVAMGAGPEELPFDLKHRRFPIRYDLRPPSIWLKVLSPARYAATRSSVRDSLTKVLERALRDAIQEPKRGAVRSDTDFYATQGFWREISSKWIRDWWERRGTYPQHEDRQSIDRFQEYVRLAEQPEFHFTDETLHALHESFVASIKNCLKVTATQMVPGSTDGLYVASVKNAGDRGLPIEDYDEKYDRQLQNLGEAVDLTWSTWSAYAREVARRYPEVVHQSQPEPLAPAEQGHATKARVASWRWGVVNPQINHCEYEAELLGRTLTFRGHDRSFERLKVLRDALMPDGQEVFDDILGDIPEYDQVVALHDDSLSALHSCASDLYTRLVTSAEFRAASEDTITGLRTAGITDLPRKEDFDDDVKYLAEYVVNNLGELDRANSTLAPVWNAGIAKLKGAAPQDMVTALQEARGSFGRAVGVSHGELATLRKHWCRKLGIPVAPVSAGLL